MIGLAGMAVLYQYAGWIVFGVIVVGVAKAVAPAAKSWREAMRERRLTAQTEREILAIRANYENDMYLRGDPGGVEGAYPAATMPLTTPLYREPRDWYDYDDGLEDWK